MVAGLNASAAYWVTAGATEIHATPSATVGSIGVYGMRASVSRQLEREGIDVEVFSAGRYKAEGLPVLPITDAERRAAQSRVDESYADFVADVAAGRRVSTTAVRNGFGEGRAVSAKEALRLGMIDQITTVDSALVRMTASTAVALSANDAARRFRGRPFDEVDVDADRRRRLERF